MSTALDGMQGEGTLPGTQEMVVTIKRQEATVGDRAEETLYISLVVENDILPWPHYLQASSTVEPLMWTP